MGRMVGNRVSLIFSPDVNDKATISLRSGFDGNVKMGCNLRSHKQASRRIFASLPGVKLFGYVKTNIAKAIRFVTTRKASSTKGSSSVMNVVLQQQRIVPHRDSHQSENLDDCIKFINSSYRKSV